MLDITKDIQSLTAFRRRSGVFLKQLRRSKRPVVLTFNGRPRRSCRTQKRISTCSTLPPAPTPRKGFDRDWTTPEREGSDRPGSFSTSSKPGMAYVVNVTPRAERDLTNLYAKINAEESDAALKWYLGLRDAILSREEHPNQCPATQEDANLRHLLYGNKPHIYRGIYRVVAKQKRVEVLHIRHGAQREFDRVRGSRPGRSI
jgi:toxin ParE1/3/4